MIKKNKAFTLIEILLVVGIMAVGFASVYVAYKAAKKSQQISATVEFATNVLRRLDDATSIADDFSKFANPSSGFSAGESSWASQAQNTPIPDNLYRSGIIPSNFITPDKYVVSPYGSKVGFNFLNNPTENVFIMTITDVDPESCMRIGQSLSSYADAVFAQNATGGGTEAKPLNGTFSREDLQTQCLSSDRANIVLIKSKPIYVP